MNGMTLEVHTHKASAATATATDHATGMTLHLHYGGARWVPMVGTRRNTGEVVALSPGFVLDAQLHASLERLLRAAENGNGSAYSEHHEVVHVENANN